MTSFWEIECGQNYAYLEPHWDAATKREDDMLLRRYWPFDYQALAEPIPGNKRQWWPLRLHVDKYPEDLDLPDMPSFWGGVLTLNPKARKLLNPIIGKAGQSTRISTRFGTFWMFVPSAIFDCLVRDQSDARYFGTGAIKEALALTFRAPPNPPPVFRIRESATMLFATDAFVAAVHQHGLTGCEFAPVKVLA